MEPSRVIHIAYLVTAFFCTILFIVSCVTVPYEVDTIGGYNASAAELAFTGGLGMLVMPALVWAQRARPGSVFNTMMADLLACGILWLLLIGGVGALTSEMPFLTSCQFLPICREFSTQMAFSWMSWIILTLILLTIVATAVKRWGGKRSVDLNKPSAELFKKNNASETFSVETVGKPKKAEEGEV